MSKINGVCMLTPICLTDGQKHTSFTPFCLNVGKISSSLFELFAFLSKKDYKCLLWWMIFSSTFKRGCLEHL